MLELRKATVDDVDQIWSVRTLAIKIGCLGHYFDDDVQQWANLTIHSGFSKVIAEAKAYVIANDQQVAGFGFLDPATSEICGIFVHPEFQGRGLGRQILSALEAEAKQVELKSLWLAATLNAEPFYISAGFNSQGRSKWNHPNGFQLDCAKMSKDL